MVLQVSIIEERLGQDLMLHDYMPFQCKARCIMHLRCSLMHDMTRCECCLKPYDDFLKGPKAKTSVTNRHVLGAWEAGVAAALGEPSHTQPAAAAQREAAGAAASRHLQPPLGGHTIFCLLFPAGTSSHACIVMRQGYPSSTINFGHSELSN